jgi:hypothetical protein
MPAPPMQHRPHGGSGASDGGMSVRARQGGLPLPGDEDLAMGRRAIDPA